MSTRFRFGTLLAVVALLAAALVAGAPAAGADDNAVEMASADNDMMFSTSDEVVEHIQVTEEFSGQFQPYTVPASAFTTDGTDPDSYFFPFTGGYYRGTPASNGCMTAPVQLAHGSTVQSMFGFLYDNDVSRNVSVILRRKALGTSGAAETMAIVSTSGASGSIQIPGDGTVIDGVVNNAGYTYYLTTCLGSDSVRLLGIWLFARPADNVFTVRGANARVDITATGVAANRVLLNLVNSGRTSFNLQDDTENNGWLFGTRGGGFEINRAGSGGTEFRFFDNGRVLMGPGAAINFDLSGTGNLEIAGTLTENSDRSAKTAIVAVDPHEVLAAVEGLDLATWQYRADPARVRHLGPMAQDFYDAFGLAGTDTAISALDVSGVALASVQALADRNADLETRIAELEALVAALLEE